MSPRQPHPLVLYFHTLRYLKLSQIIDRMLFRLSRNSPDLSDAPALRPPSSGRWECCARRASLLGPLKFRFLNVEHALSGSADWNRADWPKLWLYNLHYFDDLNADGAVARLVWHRDLLARWISDNPPVVGNGWEPYPISLRSVNWVKWALAGNQINAEWIHSLAVQARWLRGRLEWHLLGNHLFANAKALVFSGTFFTGPEADAWREKGLDILRRELAEQVLADGGHFERSPMYHAIILEDLLDLIQLAMRWPGVIDSALAAEWRRLAVRMLRWLAAMTHPDGKIALFNDAAFDIAPNLAALTAYANVLGVDAPVPGFLPLTHLEDSGYVRLQKGTAVLIADVGMIGPDYLPGHAHADTLAFELSLFGQRVVVNSGTSEYGLGPERLRQRGTAAHSTVQIDSENSSEVWSGFRVARRARPCGLTLDTNDNAVNVSCAHDGYQRLKGKPIHRRHWQLSDHTLRVSDTVEGNFHEAIARYYLHPSVVASSSTSSSPFAPQEIPLGDKGEVRRGMGSMPEKTDLNLKPIPTPTLPLTGREKNAGPAAVVTGGGNSGTLHLANGQTIRWRASGGTVRMVASSWHPEFGQSIASTCLELVFEGTQATMEFAWD